MDNVRYQGYMLEASEADGRVEVTIRKGKRHRLTLVGHPVHREEVKGRALDVITGVTNGKNWDRIGEVVNGRRQLTIGKTRDTK